MRDANKNSEPQIDRMGCYIGQVRAYEGVPLEQLAQGQRDALEENIPEAFPESMMVFCGVNQAQLNAILNAIRLSKLPPIPLKAVLTETNLQWNSVQLRDELLQEKEAIAQQAQANETAEAEN